MARYIFITGGVVSSLGKGLASAALGALSRQKRRLAGERGLFDKVTAWVSSEDDPLDARARWHRALAFSMLDQASSPDGGNAYPPYNIERLRTQGGAEKLRITLAVAGFVLARFFGHLAYEVEDIYAACERLQRHGVTINRPPRDGRMAFVRSPDNISIELLQKGTALPVQEPWASMPNTGVW